ncbi:MAG: hypothetical protein U1F76_17675 [Candidatus Competibacteraceae bacterium]
MEKRTDLNASDLSQQHFWNTTPVVCRHDTLAAGQSCAACGRGTL